MEDLNNELDKLEILRQQLQSTRLGNGNQFVITILCRVVEAVLDTADGIIAAEREQQERFEIGLALEKLSSTLGALHAMLARTRAEYHS